MAALKKAKPTSDAITVDQLLEYFKQELGTADEEKVEKFISTGSTMLDYAIANRKDGRCTARKNYRAFWQ